MHRTDTIWKCFPSWHFIILSYHTIDRRRAVVGRHLVAMSPNWAPLDHVKFRDWEVDLMVRPSTPKIIGWGL